jgi:two-component system chemotaxis response regulator CheB
MSKRDIVVVGASAGGVQALISLISQLPPDFESSVFVVLHIPPDHRSHLPEILQRETRLPVRFGVDGEEICPGHIYVASPNHHLLMEAGLVRVTNGPKENRFRPSVDALFRSAALAYGPRVIGVVLTGALDDGSSGLYAIKSRGGLAVVQDPKEAEFPSMPLNAMRTVEVDHALPIPEIGNLLVSLSSYEAGVPQETVVENEISTELGSEVGIAMGDNGRMREIMDMGAFTPFTCPECHGSLIALKEGSLLRFRCHTGHAFTLSVLMSELTQHTEDIIMNALRAVEETQLLMSHMKRHLEENGQNEIAQRLIPKIKQAEARGALIKQAAMSNEVISLDSLENQ